jgi:hypothetical protein
VSGVGRRQFGAWGAAGLALSLVVACAAGNSTEVTGGDGSTDGTVTGDGPSGGGDGGHTDGRAHEDAHKADGGHDAASGGHDAHAHLDGDEDTGTGCVAPQVKCPSGCASTSEDPNNCGSCGNMCATGLLCSSGTCASSCGAGQIKCSGADAGTPPTPDAAATDASSVDATVDGAAVDAGGGTNPPGGYCADPSNDRLNCGACNNICAYGPHSTPVCTAGSCSITCETGYADCDGKASNGCEVETDNNPASCGACGVVCAAVNDTPNCVAGVCGIGSCNTGFANCDGNVRNGCETNTNTITNCGSCGNACNIPNGTPGCPSGTCTVEDCNTGFGNCDGIASNGCETNTTSSVGNCGGCGSVCTTANATPACSGSKCSIVSCNSGYSDCDGNAGNGCEVDTNTNPNDCGACGVVCALPEATAGCAGGTCTVASCAPGYANCDMSSANGCEIDTGTNKDDCGACDNVCNLPNATAGCAGGACTVATCNPGYADCDGIASNGCEVNINTDPSDCGRCGGACSLPDATAGCSAGACTVTSCAAGFANCDGVASNGCEVNTTDDTNNCGACGKVCETTCGGSGDNVLQAVCTSSVCGVSVCDSGYTDFDHSCADGCECKLSAAALTVCSSAQSLFGGTLTPPGQITTVVSTMSPPATTTDAYYTLTFGGNTTYATYHPIISISSPNNEFLMDVWSGCGESQAMTTCTDNGTGYGTDVLQFEESYSPINAGWAVSLAEFDALPALSVVVHVHRRVGVTPTCNSYTINASND